MNEDIKNEFEKIWKEIEGIKEKIGTGNTSNIKTKKKSSNYSGLTGGIRFLIDNNFYNTPKSVKEIFNELKREGYHYSYESVDKLLRVDFHKNNKILNRFKEDKVWKYAIRK